MEPKLEYKHFLAYQQNGLTAINTFGNVVRVSPFRYLDDYGVFIGINPLWKIRLRPLSSLIKEIEYKGERFVPLGNLWEETLGQVDNITYDDHFFNSDMQTTWISEENVLQLEYIVVEKLIEWHFDVFGLIEKGLAVPLPD